MGTSWTTVLASRWTATGTDEPAAEPELKTPRLISAPFSRSNVRQMANSDAKGTRVKRARQLQGLQQASRELYAGLFLFGTLSLGSTTYTIW